jgi:hypothetical protein
VFPEAWGKATIVSQKTSVSEHAVCIQLTNVLFRKPYNTDAVGLPAFQEHLTEAVICDQSPVTHSSAVTFVDTSNRKGLSNQEV